MIPKIIHYCWLSNDPLPLDAQQYIEKWKEILPDYDLMPWNFDRFDKHSSLWVQQAFDAKKYAFAADYIRLYALYHYGGIYLDTDVEVIKSFDPFLNLKTMVCYEISGDRCEMATIGVEKNSIWIKECLGYYENKPFIRKDGIYETKVLPLVVRDVLTEKGFTLSSASSIDEAEAHEEKKMIPVFSYDYFSPKSYSSGVVSITSNTYSIHQFSGSWIPRYAKIEDRFWTAIGINNMEILTRIVKLRRYIMHKIRL